MPGPKSTTQLLKQLRSLMQNKTYVSEPIQAYIVPSTDAHNSEYLADCDQRRAFISGFTGSAGTAIITDNAALLWTDGRYYLQASQQLDENWMLMKEGVPSTPSQGSWLSKTLPSGCKVGVDPNLISHSKWSSISSKFLNTGQTLISVPTNLIDLIWTDKPPKPTNIIKPLSLNYTGKRVSEKIEDIRKQMRKKNVSAVILTALDEVAWTLNLRGSDVKYNPVFFSYVIVLDGMLIIYINPEQVNEEVCKHLDEEIGPTNYKIEPYESIKNGISEIVVKEDRFLWFSENANYALTSLVPKKKLLTEITPVSLMKIVKNSVELNGMMNAHIKDAVALCCFFSWLENNLGKFPITEVSASKKLKEIRSLQNDYVGDSFNTISAVGPHGAIIHYKPSNTTDVPITNDTLYLCDSGGQYRDGTTDVTRTFHFGAPTNYQKECFTRVLKGQIKLATSIFPKKTKGFSLDSFARQCLWQVGLDYAHGTGHGVGSFLNVHEGPTGISKQAIKNDPGLEAGMILSNEPGYYEDGQFGIRIEDLVKVVEATTPYNFNKLGFLTFETLTLVPKQTKLIDTSMLTQEEINYINSYHKKCRDIIGPLLEKEGHLETKNWLWKETEPICN